ERDPAAELADLGGIVARVADRYRTVRARQRFETVVVPQQARRHAPCAAERVNVDRRADRIPDEVELVVDAGLLGIEAELRSVQADPEGDEIVRRERVLDAEPEQAGLRGDRMSVRMRGRCRKPENP